MAYNTGNPVGSTDPRDLFDNAGIMDQYVNGPQPFYPDRFGVQRLSFAGQRYNFNQAMTGFNSAFQQFLAGSGFEAPVSYAEGVTLERVTQTFVRDNVQYRIKDPADLPYTITGDWNIESEYFASMGDSGLRQDLASPEQGARLVAGAQRAVANVAALKASAGVRDQEVVFLVEYGDQSAYPVGSGFLLWDSSSTDAADDGMVFAVTGTPVGRWIRQSSVVDAGFYGLPLASGFCYQQVVALEKFARENQRDIFFGPGVYDVGDQNWPFRNEQVPPTSFKDYGGMVIRCAGPETVLKTTSAAGADVLQLNAVKGLSIVGFPTVTATLTGFSGAGSNGVSFTFGGEDLVIDVNCLDLPFVDKGNYGDGGKAYTLQTGEGNSLGYSNVKIRGAAKNVLYGFGVDADYDNLALHPINGVTIDLFIENAYRAYVIGLAAPTVAPARLPICGISGHISAKNCQQYLVDSRGVGATVSFEVMSDKEKADLIVLPSDPSVFVTDIKSTKHSGYTVRGSVKSVDKCLSIGGVPMGGGVVGRVDRVELVHDVSFTSATTQCEVVNFGGNSVDLCDISLYGITSGYLPILEDGASSLKVDGVSIFPTVYPGDETIAAVRSPDFVAIYASPLTSVRSVLLPTAAVRGDKIRVSRLASSTGSTLAVGSVRNLSAGQWVDIAYSGTAWGVVASGSL